jgi:hypothetical protein
MRIDRHSIKILDVLVFLEFFLKGLMPDEPPETRNKTLKKTAGFLMPAACLARIFQNVIFGILYHKCDIVNTENHGRIGCILRIERYVDI